MNSLKISSMSGSSKSLVSATHTQILSDICYEKLSKNTREKWNAGQHAWYNSDSREQLVVNRLLFPCTMPRMKGVTGSSILYCTLRPYLEFSSSHLGATFKRPIRLTGACSSKNNQKNKKTWNHISKKEFLEEFGIYPIRGYELCLKTSEGLIWKIRIRLLFCGPNRLP